MEAVSYVAEMRGETGRLRRAERREERREERKEAREAFWKKIEKDW